MILINSQPTERTTDLVIDWIQYLSPATRIARVNAEDRVTDMDMTINATGTDIRFTAGPFQIALQEVTAYWYRRGELLLQPAGRAANEAMAMHLRQEQDTALGLVYHYLAQHPNGINSIHDTFLNKTIVLLTAVACGLEVPDTLVSRSKAQLLDFVAAYPACITKSLCENPAISYNGSLFSIGTAPAEAADIAQLTGHAEPVKLQTYIDKRWEIRAFYLRGRWYAMAIFSQADETTRVDFRAYNHQRMNRMVPFTLPAEVAEKLTQLMQQLNLNSGSADLIYTTDGRYVFLEVNPVGQLGMVSYPCQYNLEKIIAQTLLYEAC